MKILYFHQHFSTPHGSTGIRSYEMAKRLIEFGHYVTMVCGSYSGASTGIKESFKNGRRRGNVDGIDLIEFDLAYANNDSFIKRSLLFLSFAIKSILLVFTERYDLVFATTTPLTAGIPGIFARWCRGKHFVFEVRDLWPELPRAMGVIKNPVVLYAMSILEFASYRSANRLIGLSPGIVKGICKKGIPLSRIAMIPNGCDLDIFNQNSNSYRPSGIRSTDLLAIYTGTHGLANGLKAILDAAKELKLKGRNDIKIVLIGQGRCKNELIKIAQSEELYNVIFLEPINKNSLSKLMAGSDIGMQVLANVPSFYYGTSPNKFFDYIAAGLPVLNNYPGWLAEIIAKEKCGFVVRPSNASDFAHALELAADNRNELHEMGARSRKLAENEFDRRQLSERFVNWVCSV